MSEANKDEALRCLALSKQKFGAGETAAAANSSGSGTPAGPNLRSRASTASMGSKAAEPEESSRPFTSEQVEGIKRIKAVKAKGDLYGVLGLTKDCSDADIKKAYRKLALQFHPDKCGAPGTDDAFKAIGHAFAVLGDPDKKEQYDRYGVDPESRAASGGRGGGGGGPGFRGFDGSRFESEISPEDLFRMFMGGGMGGDFPGFSKLTRHMRFNSFGHIQDQPANAAPAPPARPALYPWSLHQTREFSDRRHTSLHRVPYYVNRHDFRARWNTPERIRDLDSRVEYQYLRNIERMCQQEREVQRINIQQAYSLFGVNEEQLRRAQGMRMPNCDLVASWNEQK
eukprot:jgi/Hompol1/3759/HPOL_003353-RA